MVDETMLEEQLDMSLDELIARGSKLNQSKKKEDGGRRASGRTGRRSGKGKDGDAMDVELAPKKLTVTVQNQLKAQGGVAKKKTSAPRSVQPFSGAEQRKTDDKPRPRLDLDAGPWAHDMFKPEGSSKPRMMTAAHRDRARQQSAPAAAPARDSGKLTKLMVSNLADDVDNNDINELFKRIGPITFAQVTYDRAGRPTGFAEVIYESEADAQTAYDSYNGVALDGKDMQIKIVADKGARGNGTFRLSSGREVSAAQRSSGTVPRGRGTTGRLNS